MSGSSSPSGNSEQENQMNKMQITINGVRSIDVDVESLGTERGRTKLVVEILTQAGCSEVLRGWAVMEQDKADLIEPSEAGLRAHLYHSDMAYYLRECAEKAEKGGAV